MKKYIVLLMAASLCAACEQRVETEPGQPASEDRTTIVNPPAAADHDTTVIAPQGGEERHDTTIVAPPAGTPAGSTTYEHETNITTTTDTVPGATPATTP